MGPVHEWRLDMVSRGWICVDFFLPMGVDALSLRFLDLSPELWMVLAARNLFCRMEHGSSNQQRTSRVHFTPTAVGRRADFGRESRHASYSGCRGGEPGAAARRFCGFGNCSR